MEKLKHKYCFVSKSNKISIIDRFKPIAQKLKANLQALLVSIVKLSKKAYQNYIVKNLLFVSIFITIGVSIFIMGFRIF